MELTPRRRNLLFAFALTAGVLNLVDRQIISVLKPTISADLGWSDNDYGTLAAWFQAGVAGGLLLAGWIVDRLGWKWANTVGVAAWSLAALTHGWSRSMAQFLLCRVTLGATEAMGTPAGMKTMITIFAPHQRSTAIGLSNAFTSLGAILAPLAIPLAAVAWGWRGTFVAAGLVGLVWAGCWWAVTRGITIAERQDNAPVSEAPQGSILRERRTWAIAVAKILSDATWWLLLFWMPDYFNRQFGLTGLDLGPPLAVAYCGSAAGSLLSGMAGTAMQRRGWSTRATRQAVMLVSSCCVLALPFTLMTHSYWWAVALLALTLAGHQGFSTSLFALIADIVPPRQIGRVTSFGSLCGNIGGMVLTKVAGLVLTAGLGYGPLFGFGVSSYFLALMWLRWMVPESRPA
ncbi:MFS transporter [Novosphingobium terrae]|uniref:MFS transporter n=1 Tax=Novosphingobium terrae TaxID=2726189 RepID=UPI0019819E1B|nr:MFS transporter [Novosphingobium terrae]